MNINLCIQCLQIQFLCNNYTWAKNTIPAEVINQTSVSAFRASFFSLTFSELVRLLPLFFSLNLCHGKIAVQITNVDVAVERTQNYEA